MGIRHAQGICDIPQLNSLFLVDKFEDALTNAKESLKNQTEFSKISFVLLEDFIHSGEKFDIGILAATSQNRLGNCRLLVNKGVKHILVEKPLGQSISEVIELITFFDQNPDIKGYVNLNMRLYESFKELKNDLQTLTQFKGEKNITVNTGTLGIGANGIHYLDLLFFLFDADDAEIQSCEIDPQTIPSGRGLEFADFGGWAVIRFFKNQEILGRALISISARSTVFGGWDIVGSHGRILLDEIQQKRIDILRKADSSMPISRYAADYLQPLEKKIESPFLGELTKVWLENLIKGNAVLPEIKESQKVHKLIFEWLSASKIYKDLFPIT